MNAVQRVVVVGGGIGGLAAATALAQRGIRTTVLERNPDFALPGVGLGQPANALRAYRELGVLDEVLDAGYIYRSMRYYDNERRLTADHAFLLGGDDVPPVCALSRQKLHGILLAAAQRAGVEIRMATTAVSIQDTGDGVDVRLSDGDELTVDLVAGFDGIRSSTREMIFGKLFQPRPLGFGAWRIQVPRPADVDAMEFHQGLGSKTGLMPLSDEHMYLFHIRPEDPSVWFQADRLHLDLRERLEGYGSYVGEIRDGLGPDSDIVYGGLEGLLIHGPWYSGRVVLGGDAAHVVPPHLTQGAAMAVEDAVTLAQELAGDDGTLEERLARYTRRRYARCAFVYNFARQMLDHEQSATTAQSLADYHEDTRRYASERIAVSDRILNERVLVAG